MYFYEVSACVTETGLVYLGHEKKHLAFVCCAVCDSVADGVYFIGEDDFRRHDSSARFPHTRPQGAYAIAPLVPGREKMVSPRGTWIYKAESPMGPFEPVKNDPVPPKDWMTLDGTLWVEDGTPYMVFCHEWCQMKDGRMCHAPLSPDFASFTAAPKTMFSASEATTGAGVITDGPFLYRSTKSGALYMIWSNTVRRNDGKDPDYCVFLRKSVGGKLAGPWTKDTLLFSKNGGHGMIFKTFDGRLMLTLHQPNISPDERMALFELEDTGETLRLVEPNVGAAGS